MKRERNKINFLDTGFPHSYLFLLLWRALKWGTGPADCAFQGVRGKDLSDFERGFIAGPWLTGASVRTAAHLANAAMLCLYG